MKRYVGFGVLLVCVAGCFAVFALITWGLAHGDLWAEVEYAIPRRRRRSGDSQVVGYPSFVPISASLAYGLAILLSGIAHIRGRLRVLIASGAVGVVAAVWAAVSGLVYGRDGGSAIFAIIIAGVAIAFSLYSTIKTVRDERRTPSADAAQATSRAPLYRPAPGLPQGTHAVVPHTSGVPPRPVSLYAQSPSNTGHPMAGHMLPPRIWGFVTASERRSHERFRVASPPEHPPLVPPR